MRLQLHVSGFWFREPRKLSRHNPKQETQNSKPIRTVPAGTLPALLDDPVLEQIMQMDDTLNGTAVFRYHQGGD